MKKSSNVVAFDLSSRRLKERAEKYYGEGDYLSALRFAREEIDTFGGDEETFALLADIYEIMGLHSSAINCWFRYMDVCLPEDLPEVYEGLAVNYLNLGNEAQSAFYYNKLIDADDTLTDENRSEIAQLFSSDKKYPFRFVYPPELSDYSAETGFGAFALKNGDLNGAMEALSKVEKGSKEYPAAREMQAVACLLSGDPVKAEEICLALTEAYPENIQALATLAAVYTELGESERSEEIAKKLVLLGGNNAEEKYKIATVCCENGMDAEALALFADVEKELPYDGNVLYFKAVAAYRSGNGNLAIRTLEKLCTIYPDAAVAKYYLREIRRYRENREAEPEMLYFYRLPEAEREFRIRALASLGKASRSEAEAVGAAFAEEDYFSWCFDEMDGMAQDLQYLGAIVAERAGIDSFLRELLLDCEVKDALKIELLRLLYERNEDAEYGVVLCNIYRKIYVRALRPGVKKRGMFISAYAKTASRFSVLSDSYGERVYHATKRLYEEFKQKDCWEKAESSDDLACTIYLMCGFGEVGKTADVVASVFEANAEKVKEIMEITGV